MTSVFAAFNSLNILLGIAVLLLTVKYQCAEQLHFALHAILLIAYATVDILMLPSFTASEAELFISIMLPPLLWNSTLLYAARSRRLLRQENLRLQNELLANSELYENVKVVAMSDGLTNIANRRSFDTLLKSELASAFKHRTPLSLILMDLDKFKVYNDTFGHLSGDKLLARIGRLLRENVRSQDFPARYGGEEFSIILPRTSLKEAQLLAEKLRLMIASAAGDEETSEAQITASFGIAAYEPCLLDHQPPPEKLIAIADKALYQAKRNGRNSSFAFTIFQ